LSDVPARLVWMDVTRCEFVILPFLAGTRLAPSGCPAEAERTGARDAPNVRPERLIVSGRDESLERVAVQAGGRDTSAAQQPAVADSSQARRARDVANAHASDLHADVVSWTVPIGVGATTDVGSRRGRQRKANRDAQRDEQAPHSRTLLGSSTTCPESLSTGRDPPLPGAQGSAHGATHASTSEPTQHPRRRHPSIPPRSSGQSSQLGIHHRTLRTFADGVRAAGEVGVSVWEGRLFGLVAGASVPTVFLLSVLTRGLCEGWVADQELERERDA
jgi:hypothetical protein